MLRAERVLPQYPGQRVLRVQIWTPGYCTVPKGNTGLQSRIGKSQQWSKELSEAYQEENLRMKPS